MRHLLLLELLMCFFLVKVAEADGPRQHDQSSSQAEEKCKEYLEFWGDGPTKSFQGVKTSARNNVNIYYQVFTKEGSTKAVVISSGRTECMLKYTELIQKLNDDGVSVFIMDHRGQGFSDRLVQNDPDLGHVENFSDYVTDFKKFVDTIVRPAIDSNTELYLVAHSMGGCIAARYLQESSGNNVFKAAVLSAPMFEINTPVPGWMAALTTKKLQLFDEKTQKIKAKFIPVEAQGASAMPGSQKYNPDLEFKASTTEEEQRKHFLTHDRIQFEAYRLLYKTFNNNNNNNKHVTIGRRSNRWFLESYYAGKKAIEQAGRIDIPVLILQATEDSIVTAAGQQNFQQNMGSKCKIEPIVGAYHEPFIESSEYRTKAFDSTREFIGISIDNQH